MKKILLLLMIFPLIGLSQQGVNIDENGNIRINRPGQNIQINNGNVTINNKTINSYNNQVFLLVMAKETGYEGQLWRTSSEFPKEEIKSGWDDGKDITSLTYGNGVWVLLMAKGTGYEGQQYSTSSEFPKEKIKSGWDDGKDIIFINPGY